MSVNKLCVRQMENNTVSCAYAGMKTRTPSFECNWRQKHCYAYEWRDGKECKCDLETNKLNDKKDN